MRQRTRWLARIVPVIALVAVALVVGAAGTPQVDRFTPQGQAKGVRQVAVRFSEPMVAFGDPRLADPFSVKCEGDPERTQGRGRWADQRNWIYDFAADLPAGQRCRFTLNAGLTSAAGTALAGKREFTFDTGGPAVMSSLPGEGEEEIDEEQIFLLAFDAPLDPASFAGAWCEADGINEQIPLKLLPEKETRELLTANRDNAFNLFRLYFPEGRDFAIGKLKVEDKRFRDLPVAGAKCARRLPAGAQVSIVIGPEVKSKTGLARGAPQRLTFRVRPDFVVDLTCQRVKKDAACLPITPIRLAFNAPVPRAAAAGIRLKSEPGQTFEPVLEPHVKTVDSVEFRGPFPEKTRFTVELPRGFKDDAGREPKNKASFPLPTATDEHPPLVKFPGRFGILELKAEPVLPVTVRNVEPTLAGQTIALPATAAVPGRSLRLANDETQIMQRLQRFLNKDSEYFDRLRGENRPYPREGEISAIREGDQATAFELPRAGGDKPMEVIGIPLPKPGFYIVELASPRLGRALHDAQKPYYVSTSVLVTNLAVHLKHGREGSLVWVTALDSGRPVAEAKVSVRDCTGQAWFTGTTDANGIAWAGDRLPFAQDVAKCGDYRRALVAFARLGEDLSFTYSDWNEGIQPWNFNLHHNADRRTPLSIHTVFDRTLFRAGETVSMKHVARVPVSAGFRIPGNAELPSASEIEHLGSGQKYKLTAHFDDQGVADGTWKIPPEAKLGSYRLNWPGRDIQGQAEFRVEAFRVPLMRAALAAPKEPLIRPSAARLDAAVNYLSGGPASGLPVKVRHRIENRGVSFASYPEFRFDSEPLQEGIVIGSSTDAFDTYDPDEDGSAPGKQGAGPTAARTLTLDGAGTAAISIDQLGPVVRPASLFVEMEYNDPNGERLAVATRVALHPAALYLGLKPDGWVANKNGVRTQVVALDPAGKPLASQAVRVDLYERKSFSSRRRLIGGFYAYESTTETKKLGGGCSGTTDERGFLFCTVKPGLSGELILLARAQDKQGREALASTSVWVRGADEWWFDPSDSDRIDLIPEKKHYEPGETAKFQVRMPFRSATVLVTVEREGVLEQKVVALDGQSPVIEVPIIGSYGPNVFVSALAVRGRVDPEVPGPYAWLKRAFYRLGYWLGLVDEIPVERDTRPTALVDLSKPAYKLGMAEIQVGHRAYTLAVKVTPDRDVFRVRETARVNVQVTDSDGKPAAHGEIALAAVDEGLLELSDNSSWNLLDALLGERPVEVSTATVQGQVIGKRHFGKKAAAPGGGGGQGGARELFDTLLTWKARVPLDAQGHAVVDVPLNDTLSAFRIVAVAQAGADRFGTGRANIRTTQDLMLLSGLPPLVREQDEFSGMFTLRNTTGQALAARFEWSLRDLPADDPNGRVIANGHAAVALAANEAKLVSVPVKVPVNITGLHWEVTATAQDNTRDRLRVAQKVIEVHPVRVYQATLAQLDKRLEFPAERPAGAVPGRGGIRVEVMGTLVGEMSGVREYFQRYPYTCIEQRTSRAIGLGDDALWKSVTGSLPNHLDHDGLARYFPVDWAQGSDALTAYLVQIANASGREWPEQAQDRMLKGLEAFATGRIVRGSALPTADLTVRKLAAIEALARHGRAKPEMLESISIDPALWPTSALLDWIGILQRVDKLPRRTERLQEALGLLRGRLNFQGTVMTFSTERTDALWWLMVSADVNANRALLAVLNEADWREDLGRLVRGSLARQKHGHWGTTVANAWGTAAIARFAQAFEQVPASGTAVATLGGTTLNLPVSNAKQTRDFEWPPAREMFSLTHTGQGAPWAIVQSRAALPLKAPLFTGYRIKRTLTPVEQKEQAVWSRGDVYRVTLEIDAQSDMTWVVIDDPIPGGAAILGSGLGRDAASLTAGEMRAGAAGPMFVERSFEAYRAYYEFVPKGHFKLEYTVRVNNPGRFDLPATRVEAMYAPEMFGAVPNSVLAVVP